jgi:restriction system protein
MMPGFGPIGSHPIGALPFSPTQIDRGRKLVTLTSTAILTYDRETDRGLLVKSLGTAWIEIVRMLGDDWNRAFQIDARTWEKILAGALKQEGFQVVLTPPSGDHGSDIIATRDGVGSIRMLGSMKAYAPGRVVGRDHVDEVLGVVDRERATKAMIVTTSDFAPRLLEAPGMADLIPYRLELKNGDQLRDWLSGLVSGRSTLPSST